MTLLEQLQALPPDQKLELVTKLWDDLAASAPRLSLPSEEMAEMQQRRMEMREHPDIAIDSNELWRRVDGN